MNQNFNRNSLKFVILGSVTLVLIITGFFIYLNKSENKSILGINETTEESTVIKEQQQQQETNDPYLITYSGQDGKTALELLKEQEEVITQQSSFGEYVEMINDIKGGTDNKYWLFYVNGEQGVVGADKYETNNNETIEWRFE